MQEWYLLYEKVLSSGVSLQRGSTVLYALFLSLPVSAITRVYTVEEMIQSQASGKEPSFSGILYATLMSIDIDNEADPARIISFRWYST